MALTNVKTCEIVQQLDFYDLKDLYGTNKDEFVKRIESIQHLKKYAYIVHNCDTLENGELKKSHFHLILTFSASVNVNTICEILKIENQYLNKIKTTTALAFQYLLHLNDKTKYQYEINQVISNFDYTGFINESKFKIDDILEKIAIGEIREFNITQYISVKNYTKYKRYIDNAFNYRYKKIEFEKEGQRKMQVIFISGLSGSGKTTSAKNYCLENGFSFYISSGGKNLLDDYKGQDCIILDDLRDSDYKFNELLKLLDNNTSSNASARYFNKSLNECKLLIITSTKPIEEWYTSLLYKGLSDSSLSSSQGQDYEQKKQFFRRISFYMIVDNEWVKMLVYDNKNNSFKLVGQCPNEILKQFENQQQEVNTTIENFTKIFAKK